MIKKEAVGVWFDPLKFKPNDIKDYREGDYVVLKVKYKNNAWDYKLGWYHSMPGNYKKFQFYIIDPPCCRYSLVGWTLVPEYDLH